MKLLINLCAHDGIISHYTGVGTIVKRYIKMFQMILEKRGYEYAINLYTPEYHSNSFGYSAYTHEVHKQMKNVNIIQISNGSNGAVNYGTIKDWKLLSKNTANAINSLNISNYDLVLTISNDTPFAGLNELLNSSDKNYKIWIPHSTGKIHKVNSAIKDGEDDLQARIDWEKQAVNYINQNTNSYLGGTGRYISMHMINQYSLKESKLINIINGEILSQQTIYQETDYLMILKKKMQLLWILVELKNIKILMRQCF